MVPDELFFEIINIRMRAYDQNGSGTVGAAAFKFFSVNGACVINVQRISVFDSKRGTRIIGSVFRRNDGGTGGCGRFLPGVCLRGIRLSGVEGQD